MRFLILGSGAREHAMASTLRHADASSEIHVAPGNAGMEEVARTVPITLDDLDALVSYAKREKIDLTVAGSEEPLVRGAWDRFDAARQRLFGPSSAAAQLEGSKVFAKQFMQRHGIPTASFEIHDEIDRARAALSKATLPVVLKVDGLAAGKGVLLVEKLEEGLEWLDDVMVARRYGSAGDRVVLEECLLGPELSVFAVCDGYSYRILGWAQDHKRAWDGDRGPNTGGMGAYSPVPFVDPASIADIENRVLAPTLVGMLEDGMPYRGFLYLGLMLTPEGPKVLEYNVRLGDPEAQVLLPRLASSFGELLVAAEAGDVRRADFRLNELYAVGVVVAAEGYPTSPQKGARVRGIDRIRSRGGALYCAGIERQDDGFTVSGGRILTVVGLDADFGEARRAAYAAVREIDIDGSFYRTDIGHQALELKTWQSRASAS